MMSISAIQSLEYYDDLAAEDYYNDGGEPPGVWAGSGALLLGLNGQIDSHDYYNIMRGYDPKGNAICDKPGNKHRPGFDLTFSPPKSVSVIWARSEAKLKQQIQHAHYQAVLAAIKHLEQHAAVTRRGHNGLRREKVLGLICATYEHSTSRALDVHLHHHVLCSNLAPRSDGTWGTLESLDLFLWQRSASAHYRTELSSQLQTLGFPIEVDKDAFHITGVPKALCKHFSKRSVDIQKALDATGLQTSASRAGDIIKLSTRTKKKQVNRPALFKRWQTEMDEQSFTLDTLTVIQQPQASLDAAAPIFDELSILERVSERQAVFRKQDIYRAAAEIAQLTGDDGQQVEHLTKSLLAQPEMVNLGLDAKHNQLFTTKAQLEAEQQLISNAKTLRKLTTYHLPEAVIAQSIAAQPFELSDEQLQAVLDVCSPQAFAICQGSAGTGKTTSLNIVRQTYQQEGFTVIGAAIAKLAADNLAREAGVEAFTVARLLIDIKLGRSSLTNKTVLLIDEAGQLGTTDLAALLYEARNAGCKVILSGDEKQCEAITGGALRYLSRPEILGASRIETIRRQNQYWARVVVAQIRDGHILEALKTCDERSLIHFANDSTDARKLLVKQWQHYRQVNPGKHAIVLAQRWQEVQSLCNELRAIYQAEGLVGNENLVLDCTVSDKPMRFTFSKGERIRLTKNDYRRGFSNGTLGTITDLKSLSNGDIRFTVQADDGRQLSFTRRDYCDEHGRVFLAQAYALTVYSAQGITVNGDVFVLHNTGMDRATSYVAGSRHKDNCHWVFNQTSIQDSCNNGEPLSREQAMNAVAKLMSEDRYKGLAIEHIQDKQLKNYQTGLAVEHSAERSFSLF